MKKIFRYVILYTKIFNKIYLIYRKKDKNKIYKNKIDSWAYPWNLCLWYNKMLVLTPKFNLVENIGAWKVSNTYIH